MAKFDCVFKKPDESEESIFNERNFKRVLGDIDWPFAIGFAFCQVWNILCVSMPDPLTYDQPFLDLRWLSLASAGLFAIGVACWPNLSQTLLAKKQAVFSMGIIAAAGSILGPLSALASHSAVYVLLFSAVAVGVGFTGLFLIWFDVLISTRNKITLAFGVILAALFTYPFANVLLSGQINIWVAALAASVLPLISAFILTKRLHIVKQSVKKKQETVSIALDPAQKRMLSRFCLCLFLVIASTEIARNTLFERGELDFYAGVINLCALVLKFAGGLYILMVLEARNAPAVSKLYRIVFLLLLSVVLCLPLPLEDIWLTSILINLGTFCFQMITTFIAYEACSLLNEATFAILGSARAAWAFAGTLGIIANWLTGTYGLKNMQILTCVLGLAIAVAFVFVFSDQMCSRILSNMPTPASIPRFRSRCKQVAQRFNMSERETEVFKLMVKGRSAPRIADELSISVATVNSHIYHIYQKANVHSNQELLDLIENEPLAFDAP